MALPKATGHHYTYADYRPWPDDQRWGMFDHDCFKKWTEEASRNPEAGK